ncbi:hypothetical protein GMORB2_3396 [Geosmithia morbida]|uniref:Uncharacterized protein n=1 Tax=Geosmithia morbida TaxID=1094350 RepID=A0A9P4YNU1_9HYPO|nr:uncharacterized protein GMORB2_3396 [Geosmithia morbida]KAF4119985.1 hypothetical protein GMORB2_3396 [Geosmithia morbida]
MSGAAQEDSELWMFALDDLGRHRQEEFPLETHTKFAPYTPRQNNGLDRIPKKTKLALAKAWGSQIDDEESRQVDGLEVGEFSWRHGQQQEPIDVKKPEFYKPSNKVTKASPLKRKKSHARKNLPAQDSTWNSSTVPSVSKAASPSEAASLLTRASLYKTGSSSGTAYSFPVLPSSKSIPKTTFTSTTAAPLKLASPSGRATSSADMQNFNSRVPTVPGTHAEGVVEKSIRDCDITFNIMGVEQRWVRWNMCSGQCIVYPARTTSSPSIAMFAINMQFDALSGNLEGFLHLSRRGFAVRSYPLSEIDTPPCLQEKRFCAIYTHESPPIERLWIELKSVEKTAQFCQALGLVKKIAISTQLGNSDRHESISQESTQLKVPITPLQNGQSSPRKDGGHKRPAEDGSKSGSKRQPTLDLADAMPLLDLGDYDINSGEGIDFKRASKDAIRLIDRVADAELAWGSCMDITSIVRGELSETLAQALPGRMRCEHREITQQFVSLVGSLAKCKRSSNRGTPVAETPKPMKDIRKPITYSPESLVKLKDRATVPSEGSGKLDSFMPNTLSYTGHTYDNTITSAVAKAWSSHTALRTPETVHQKDVSDSRAFPVHGSYRNNMLDTNPLVVRSRQEPPKDTTTQVPTTEKQDGYVDMVEQMRRLGVSLVKDSDYAKDNVVPKVSDTIKGVLKTSGMPKVREKKGLSTSVFAQPFQGTIGNTAAFQQHAKVSETATKRTSVSFDIGNSPDTKKKIAAGLASPIDFEGAGTNASFVRIELSNTDKENVALGFPQQTKVPGQNTEPRDVARRTLAGGSDEESSTVLSKNPRPKPVKKGLGHSMYA